MVVSLWTLSEEQEEVVKLLLNSRRVEPNAKDSKGRTALNEAIFYAREATVQLLLSSNRVDSELVDENGDTLLAR
jgi:ankyrin repeat protein